jgi:hypothetical protein
MQKKLPLALLIASATAATSQAALIWTVGLDDGGWPAGDGGGPNTSFVQENGAINPLPGSPTSTEVPQGADNDYYFAGLYNTVIASNATFYGLYTPVGVVAANEEAAERAFAAADNDLRYHFNLPATLGPNDRLTLTFDANNLDDPNATNTDPRYGASLYFNGVLVMPEVIIRAPQLDQDFVSAQFSLASVNAVTGPGADNIVSLKGTNFNSAGGGNWMGIDYIRLDSQPVPEPSVGIALLVGAVGLTPFIRRRRS